MDYCSLITVDRYCWSQYNTVLQYKLSPQAFFSAIQFCVLQYDFQPFQTLSCNKISSISAIQPLYCNTFSSLNKPLQLAILFTVLQYKIFFFSKYNLGSSPITVLHQKKKFIKFFFSFLLLENAIKIIYIFNFFSFSRTPK